MYFSKLIWKVVIWILCQKEPTNCGPSWKSPWLKGQYYKAVTILGVSNPFAIVVIIIVTILKAMRRLQPLEAPQIFPPITTMITVVVPRPPAFPPALPHYDDPTWPKEIWQGKQNKAVRNLIFLGTYDGVQFWLHALIVWLWSSLRRLCYHWIEKVWKNFTKNHWF